MLDDSQLDSLELYSHHTLQVAMTNNNGQNRRLFKFYFKNQYKTKVIGSWNTFDNGAFVGNLYVFL